jgi:hypothetical protein
MQQLITGLLSVVYIPLNMFRASLCPSSGAYQLQQQPLVYRRNVVVAVLFAVVGPNPLNAELNSIFHLLVLLGAHPILHISRIRVNGQCAKMHGPTNPKFSK